MAPAIVAATSYKVGTQTIRKCIRVVKAIPWTTEYVVIYSKAGYEDSCILSRYKRRVARSSLLYTTDEHFCSSIQAFSQAHILRYIEIISNTRWPVRGHGGLLKITSSNRRCRH